MVSLIYSTKDNLMQRFNPEHFYTKFKDHRITDAAIDSTGVTLSAPNGRELMLLKYFLFVILFLSCILSNSALARVDHFPRGTQDIFISNVPGIRSDLLKNIAPVINKSIANGNYPGAVVLIAHRGNIIYRGVFGERRIVPNAAPMRFNTIFDIASLTKVVATTPAVMQLVEQNKLDLDAPVAKYWPEFAAHGKESVTIRELLTHTSGLPADISESTHGEIEALHEIQKLTLENKPGTKFLYSDVNFIVLAHLVEIVTRERFDHYVDQHIFKILKMRDTTFLPAKKLRDRIAPTEMMDHKLRWGDVHDPIAHALGGVSGNAGLFSDAADLGIYAQCLLDGGKLASAKKPTYVLGPLTILKMISPETPPNIADVRGLGWDIDSSYSNRGVLFPVLSFGHSGWTGTSLWIDPATQTWIIILTSRTHPTPLKHNQLIEDRREIANIVSASITDITFSYEKNTSVAELDRAYHFHKG